MNILGHLIRGLLSYIKSTKVQNADVLYSIMYFHKALWSLLINDSIDILTLESKENCAIKVQEKQTWIFFEWKRMLQNFLSLLITQFVTKFIKMNDFPFWFIFSTSYIVRHIEKEYLCICLLYYRHVHMKYS